MECWWALDRLKMAGWLPWPTHEREEIHGFFSAGLEAWLGRDEGLWEVAELLKGLAASGDDIAPLIERVRIRSTSVGTRVIGARRFDDGAVKETAVQSRTGLISAQCVARLAGGCTQPTLWPPLFHLPRQPAHDVSLEEIYRWITVLLIKFDGAFLELGRGGPTHRPLPHSGVPKERIADRLVTAVTARCPEPRSGRTSVEFRPVGRRCLRSPGNAQRSAQ